MIPRLDREAALQLRIKGQSYGEIRRALGVSKSTLSFWFKNLTLSPRTLKILQPKQRKGLLALAEFNKRRTISIRKENIGIADGLKSMVGILSDRDIMLIGAALYWGEGYKNFKKGTYEHINFANSDPDMIRVFLMFLKRVLNIASSDLKAHIFLYPGMDQKKAIRYWVAITKIPRDHFYIYEGVSKSSKKKRPQNLLPYGTIQIRLIRRKEFFKIRGLIDGIIEAAR